MQIEDRLSNYQANQHRYELLNILKIRKTQKKSMKFLKVLSPFKFKFNVC